MSVIVAARRSPVAPRTGALAAHELHQLASPVIAALLADAGLPAGAVDELILSNALGAGGNPARVVALASGLPMRVAGLSIDRQCCGGLDAILLADALIRAGQCRAVIAGGAESYSRRPLRLRTDPGGGAPQPYDAPPFTPWPDRNPGMAQAADALARRLGIDAAAQDRWAVDSHARARRSPQPGIVPVAGLLRDPFARNLTPALASRAQRVEGSISAANMAVAADGAAFCLIVSDALAGDLSGPGWRILSGTTLGDAPECPGLAPVPAIRAALAAAGLGPADLAVAEIMEAFAVQAMACVAGAGLDPARVNPAGGALARGHPIGASGAVNAVQLCHALAPGQAGLVAIAAAGGLGTAMVLRGR